MRRVYQAYTQQGLSINGIAHMLHEEQIPPGRGRQAGSAPRCGVCCATRRIRAGRALGRQKFVRDSASPDRYGNAQGWPPATVPTTNDPDRIGSRSRFRPWSAKKRSRWPKSSWSKTSGILPGARSNRPCCRGCWFVSAAATRSIAPLHKPPRAKLYYYRCLGSDAYRHLRGAVCDNPPVRQDHLDAVVWKEVLRLLEDPGVIQEELNRRLEAAKKADPLKQREESLHREQTRLEKNMDRLLNAYQEGLVSLEQLRSRMPDLRKQQQAAQAEWQSLKAATADHAYCLRLVETLTDFCPRLRLRADALEVTERQKIVRLLLKEILVGKDTLTIRHSIRIPKAGPDPGGTSHPPHSPQQPPRPQPGPGYLLRSGRRAPP